MHDFTLILVRHGHVEGIRPERFRGRIDLPLTKLGRRQAAATAEFVAKNWPASSIYCSPLSRCVDTAEMIGNAQGLVPKRLRGLLDIDYGAWQGRERDEVALEEPDLFKAWMEQPHLTMIEGAESLQDVQARLARALWEIQSQHSGETVVAVGHDSTNRILLTLALDLPLSRYWHLQQDPCAINILHFGAHGCRVAVMNETAHLALIKLDLP